MLLCRDKLTVDTTNESQEVSPFPAGDHKAHINRRTQRHSKHKTEQKYKRSTKEVPPWNRNIFASWVPHLLTDEQNRQRVKEAKMLLQMFQTYDKKQFANVVAGDENWVYYFEQVRKVSNKISATKHSRRPITVKRSLSVRKVWYVIFFSGKEVTIEVPVEKGKTSPESTTKT